MIAAETTARCLDGGVLTQNSTMSGDSRYGVGRSQRIRRDGKFQSRQTNQRLLYATCVRGCEAHLQMGSSLPCLAHPTIEGFVTLLDKQTFSLNIITRQFKTSALDNKHVIFCLSASHVVSAKVFVFANFSAVGLLAVGTVRVFLFSMIEFASFQYIQ